MVSDREPSVALDVTARSSWETSVTPRIDDLPLEASEACEVLLIKEPETRPSPGNLNRLLALISERVGDRQLILTTHSSLVVNKLGADTTIMFDGTAGVRLSDLSDNTKRDFMKLCGHDTLRMVDAKRAILVEGPSDEAIVQRTYNQRHGKMPLEGQVEVISVNSSAFKRFLDLAMLLNLELAVVTDNDGDTETVRKTSPYPSTSVMPSANRIILASACSGKATIMSEAAGELSVRSALATCINNSEAELRTKANRTCGCLPPHMRTATWF